MMGAGDNDRDGLPEYDADGNPLDGIDHDRSDWTDEGDDGRDGRLDLRDDDDVSLPWLESDDDDEEPRSDAGRLIGLMVLGLAALAAIVGGIWWATHRQSDTAAIADGSTVPAPEIPYKQAPENPGGKQFDGTGDTAFGVAEGQNKPAMLGQNSGAPASPSIDVGTKPSGAASPAPSASATAPAPKASASAAAANDTGGVAVQVGAYSSRAAAEAGWTKLAGNAALAGVRHRIVEGQADIGTVYRLQAVTADQASANSLCSRLKSAGLACQVKN